MRKELILKISRQIRRSKIIRKTLFLYGKTMSLQIIILTGRSKKLNILKHKARRSILGVIFSPFCQLIRRKTVGLAGAHVGDTT